MLRYPSLLLLAGVLAAADTTAEDPPRFPLRLGAAGVTHGVAVPDDPQWKKSGERIVAGCTVTVYRHALAGGDTALVTAVDGVVSRMHLDLVEKGDLAERLKVRLVELLGPPDKTRPTDEVETWTEPAAIKPGTRWTRKLKDGTHVVIYSEVEAKGAPKRIRIRTVGPQHQQLYHGFSVDPARGADGKLPF